MKSFLNALVRALVRPPFGDESGGKGWLDRFTRAPPHVLRQLRLTIAGWPCWSRSLRIAFISDFHTGSHAHDVARLRGIMADATAFRPDLVLYGGDFVNMQLFGGGRVPPSTIASVLGELRAPLGAFAVLGNHDYTYGEQEVLAALRAANIVPLDDERHQLSFEDAPIDLIGVPDAHVRRLRAKALLASVSVSRPAIVLVHDPACFADLAKGPHMMLAGHTHGGQICVPGIGPLVNMSRAPLRHSFGLIEEDGRQMYVTSGIGTSGLPIRIGAPPEIVLLHVTGGP